VVGRLGGECGEEAVRADVRPLGHRCEAGFREGRAARRRGFLPGGAQVGEADAGGADTGDGGGLARRS
ncbi:hypothetical protein, partial [Streptomyces sp. Agncl-13]|uniref:hypothetical protein n=1 Tax=Streptomyces sp. Agncl-13 TaxID=3400628 RepID=UPI003A84B646